MALRFGVHGIEEAKVYLADPILRRRLEEVIAVIAEQLHKPDQYLDRLMGSGLDAACVEITSSWLFLSTPICVGMSRERTICNLFV
jgi:hypothetical protein